MVLIIKCILGIGRLKYDIIYFAFAGALCVFSLIVGSITIWDREPVRMKTQSNPLTQQQTIGIHLARAPIQHTPPAGRGDI